jgi:subtilisin-like proprotein convertase family protein
MSFKPRTWLVISLLCFFGAAMFWDLGRKEAARRKTPAAPSPISPVTTSAPPQAAGGPLAPALLSAAVGSIEYVSTNRFPEPPKARYPLRLRNSDTKLDELARRDDALLLANALLDLRKPLALQVPDSLQPHGPTENYVVQSKVSLDRGFRQLLTSLQAEIISYVPNNALLVRMDSAKAEQIRQSPLVRSVIPWIPYFKLSPALLKDAISQTPPPEEKSFRLLVFPQEAEAMVAELRIMNLEVLGQSRSPFGTEVIVRAASSRLADFAQNDRVQWIDPYVKRQAANDLTALSLGSSTNGGVDAQYLGLTGKGIRVNVNDTGVDETHADLVGRVLDGEPAAHVDPDGHGTHVAGTIASSGKNFPALSGTNMPPGSATNASFQGKAPEAIIVPVLIDPFFGSFLSDNYLQEAAALNDALISNNSWGYLGINEYDSAAASYDAAVRDALPLLPGQQPVTFVFAAGNSGGGDNDGLGGSGDTVTTPATAKNVITVGALESLRRITNGPVTTNAFGEPQTNSFFYADTDSNNEIADYSSRGNVGINLEGEFGRFKPDVVAPGSFIISTRSVDWKDPILQIDHIPLFLRDQSINATWTNFYTVQVPDNSIEVSLRSIPNAKSPVPIPPLLIGVRKDVLPPPNDFEGTNFVRFPVTGGGNWVIAIENTTNFPVAFDLIAIVTVTNAPVSSEYFTELKKLNDQVGPLYRYESGTSMAAPAISGMIALMHEFFTNRLNYPLPSPALTKALLINGSDTVGDLYDFQVKSTLNMQGWGKPELPRIIPKVMDSKPTTPESWPVRFYDQTNNAPLATGESQTRTLTFSPTNAFAALNDLRVTLVWTDPPGNPGVGIKLVNDLDLVITNLTSGEVYYGNDIKSESLYNDPIDTTITNVTDVVNNVENVFISGPLGDKYSITVVAKRVNVNAVTSEPTEIVQDYALVVSIGDRTIEDGFKIDEPVGPRVQSGPALVTLTNEVPLMNERVGANPAVAPGTNGVVPQWRFYRFVNEGSTNPYVAIITFQADNLSRPRLAEGDIDLYVSTDPALLTLDPAVLQASILQGRISSDQRRGASRTRLGTEFVAFTNSAPDSEYYIAVKAEDQQAAEYALLAIARSEPFDSDENGCRVIHFIRSPTVIPDGSNENPSGLDEVQPALFIGIGTRSSLIRNARVDMDFTHDDVGDLTALLKGPTDPMVTLFSHTFTGVNTNLVISFDDSGTNVDANTYSSEGPIKLNALVGSDALGVWQFALFDNSPLHAGTANKVSLCIDPQNLECLTTDGCLVSILPNSWYYDFIDIPFDASQLQVCVSENVGPVEIYLRRGLNRPTQTDWDAFQEVLVGDTNCLTLDYFSSPPIAPGRWQLGIFNPNPFGQTVRLKILITRGLLSDSFQTFLPNPDPLGQAITDDAQSQAGITIQTNRPIVEARVGIRLDHPRVSDLAIHLVSPRGTRWLLKENRGNASVDGLGKTFGLNGLVGTPEEVLTNYAWATFTDSTNLADGAIKFMAPPFAPTGTEAQPTVYLSDFELTPTGYQDTTSVLFEGWRVLNRSVMITNDSVTGSLHSQVLALSDGAVATELPIRGERQYRLSFAYRKDSSAQTQQVSFAVGPGGGRVEPVNLSQAIPVPKFRGSPGQEISLSTLTNGIIVDALGSRIGPDGTAGAFRSLPLYALVGQWSASATTLTDQTILSAPFFIGAEATLSVPEAPGDYYLWLGINDPDHTDNIGSPTDFIVTARWKPTQLDSFRYVISGVTNRLFPKEYWQTNTLRFIGRNDAKDLAFLSEWNSTTLIDDVVVSEPFAAAYYLAEEPLPTEIKYQANTPAEPLIQVPSVRGESAQGTWRLDIKDTRAKEGANASKPAILWSWYLQVLFAPAQQPILLTNCVEFTDIVRRDGIRYYAVDVPFEAINVTNTLIGSNVVFFYNGDQVPDPDVDIPVISPFELQVGSPLPGIAVAPGSRYYLGVMNSNLTSRGSSFRVRVDFELPMIALTNGAPLVPPFGADLAGITNTLIAPVGASAPANILYPGTNMHWYKHVVEPHPDLHSVVYELRSTNAELHLVAKRGLAGVDYLPTPTRYDYHSINYQDTNEVIIVRTDSFPVRLTPIPWILGVYNSGTNTATYDLTAMRLTTPLPVGFPVPPHTYSITNWTDATNEFGFSLQPGEALNYFHALGTLATNSALLIEVLNLTGDADLFLRRNGLPSPYLYDFSDLQTGTNSEHISIHTNLFLPTFGSPTNWFFNVVNHDSLQVTGLVRVATASGTNALDTGLQIFQIADPMGDGIRIQWRALVGERYDVRYSTNAVGPFDQSLGIIRANTSTAQAIDPLPSTNRFYEVIRLGP